MDKIRFLNGNTLKLIAAVLMVFDHAAILFLPYGSVTYTVFRSLGRIAFPLFAYMLAEGCHYTKDKLKHFALLFSVAVFCQVVYYFFDNGNLEMSVLITFSLSTLAIYALQYFKKSLFSKETGIIDKIFAGGLFAATVIVIYELNEKFSIDYGFWGCMLPVFVSLFDLKDVPMPENSRVKAILDNEYTRFLCFALGLALLAAFYYPVWGNIQLYSFFSLVILLFYNGKKGKLNLKYFFYAFYPLHLVLLQGIAWLL
ncbi:MAG: hypothetical protein J6Z36_01860 [Clostridia bacterium]|nr:hypothetical protein [Clostridia bacterium]